MRKPQTDCDGFAVSDHFFNRLAVEIPDRYIRLQQSEEWNNYVLVAHPETPLQMQTELRRFLLRTETQTLLAPALDQYADQPQLIAVSKSDYPPRYFEQLKPYWQTNKSKRRASRAKIHHPGGTLILSHRLARQQLFDRQGRAHPIHATPS